MAKSSFSIIDKQKKTSLHPHFFGKSSILFPSLYSPFEDSQRQPRMYTTIAEYVYRKIFSPHYLRLSVATIPPLKGARGMFPPIAYALRPSAYSLFFRLETLFLPFFASLYYAMSQLFIYPFYTNRPRFV
ncbi:hypothetical protein HMPREF1528_00051 [Capnocytophaga sp. oral taxon 336 str. F0502]|nr:hypothetical protein HMPREF1528_00051 [Capnocytophaga sp. oral taxon 336 str. F0502]